MKEHQIDNPSYLSHCPSAAHWKHVTIGPHHGIAIPLFSIHSSKSHGIGEYPDLCLLADWCVAVGFDVIQLLPLNDTLHGTSPYSSISAFALHPIYLGLESLPYIQDYPFLQEELGALQKLSHSAFIDYKKVYENKERFLRHYYDTARERIIQSEAYISFLLSSRYWLREYAAYHILKERYQRVDWEKWPESDRFLSQSGLDSFLVQEKKECERCFVLQFLCDEQMRAAKAYAETKKVFIMGDTPILFSRDSADVWMHKHLFDLNHSAGAPPDPLCREGQNWGFPIYNWDAMAGEDYRWWIQRIQWTGRYYHMYRIDHVVGFFRIWAIPEGATGNTGYYLPREENKWIDLGQKHMMMMLEASEMLPIAEDLGTIPDGTRACLSALGICGTKVMRWERKWNEGGAFIPIQDYPLESMTTVGTHDTETLVQWWKNNPLEAAEFAKYKGWCYQPFLSSAHHKEILWDSHHSASLFHINPMQEYLSLIPGFSWQDPDHERINVPGEISDRNWCYRLKRPLEELLTDSSLQNLIREIIS